MGVIRRVVTVLATLAIASLPLVSSGSAPPADWVMFRRTPTNEVTIGGTLRTRWTLPTGGPISASPTLAGSTLYIGNNRGNVFAIDVRSGHVLWRRHLRNAVMSAPLLYRDSLFVGQGDAISTGSGPGLLYVGTGPSAFSALDRRTGRTVWESAMAGSAMPTGAIVDGTLLEHDGAGWLNAFDPQTGKRLYSHNLHSVASMSSILPLGGGRIVTIGVQENAVMALRASDGSTIWRTRFPASGSGHGDCPPVTDGVRVYCDYVMPAAGHTYTTQGAPATERAYALDVRTGAKIWDIRLETGTLPARNESAIPLLENGVLYFGSSVAPYMHAVDAATGRKIWTANVRGPVKGGSVIVAGRLYFGDFAGDLWALDAQTGGVIGVKSMPGAFNVGSPVVVGKTLVIGDDTGSIYALPLDDIH